MKHIEEIVKSAPDRATAIDWVKDYLESKDSRVSRAEVALIVDRVLS